MNQGQDDTEAQDLVHQGLELESTLDQEPRLLLDRSFLGALHVEFPEQLGAREGVAALFQLGFLHGLRDAVRVLRRDLGDLTPGTACLPVAPRLALRLGTGRRRADRFFTVHGSWPEKNEAEAHLSSLGQSGRCICFVSAGYTSGWLSGMFDHMVVALESTCTAHGDTDCCFVARDIVSWEANGNDDALERIHSVPYDHFRALVDRRIDAEEAQDDDLYEGDVCFDPESPAIHVWGPVMVLPFGGADECLKAVELIGRDPDARGVSVVVLDLGGTLIDEGYGASALEQVLDAIERWGAEPVLTGVSPLSEPVVADLSHAHLVIHKEISEAIATGFQIATLQERVV